MKPIVVGVTGGGTGGHMYPLIAVVEEVQRLGVSLGEEVHVYYFGMAGEPYRTIFANLHVRMSSVAASKLRAYRSLANVAAPFLFVWGVLQALWKVYWIMPHVLFSKGGPGSLPVVFAAAFYRIPVVVHESDVSPGRSTAIAAMFARRIAVSYEETKQYFHGREDRIVVVGNPVRSLFLRLADPAKAKQALGLDPALPTILVINGSQGSVRVNTFVLSLADTLVKSYQVLHQTGPANYDVCREQLASAIGYLDEETRRRYKLVPYFSENIAQAYAASDLIVARSGGSIFEMALFGKPVILIPLKGAARDHQRENAYAYVRDGAGVVIEEDNLFAGVFLNEVTKILGSSDVRYAMSAAARRFAKPEAANAIAKEIMHTIESA